MRYNKRMTKVSHDSETPAQGQQVITACAFIHHNFNGVTKVFLPKRAATKKFLPNKYELPGGHIDYGEEIIDGLKREIKEELGMTVRIGDPFNVFTYQNLIKGSHSIEVIYFGQFVEPLDHITIQPEDHSSFGWFSRDEILQNKSDVVATDNINYGDSEDPEYLTLLKGFDILTGQPFNFA